MDCLYLKICMWLIESNDQFKIKLPKRDPPKKVAYPHLPLGGKDQKLEKLSNFYEM